MKQPLSEGLFTSSGNTAFAGGGSAPSVVVDGALTIDTTASLDAARVSIGAGYVLAEDRLVFTNTSGITGSFNAQTGVLTLSGSSSVANYQAALRSVRFGSVSSTPTPGARVITFSLGHAVANPANGHFYNVIYSTGTWTQAKTNASNRTYFGLQGYLATLTSQVENDFVSTKLVADGWIGAQANPQTTYPRTWSWVTGPEEGTAFCSNTSSGSCASIGGGFHHWTVGEPNNSGGEGCAEISFLDSGRWYDSSCASRVRMSYVIEFGGLPTDPAVKLHGTKRVDVAYTATSLTPSAGTVTYDSGAGAVVVDAGLTALGTSTVSGATVAITSGFVSPEDTLAFVPADGISSSFDSATGVLSLSGTASVATYQAALRTVTYANSVNPLPNTQARVVTFTLDGASGTRPLQVRALPTVSLTTSANPNSLRKSLTLTATVTPSTSTGTVEFFADGSSLGTVALGSGVATFSTSSLALGSRSLASVYSGDSERLSASGTASQTISPMLVGEGPCTEGAQASECESGLCNSVAGTCGAPNGSACTANNQCANNLCGSNGYCGQTLEGACTPATAALCQSGACSANNNTCIPVGGCAVTADCGPGEECQQQTLACGAAPGLDASAGTTGYDATSADVVVDSSLAVIGARDFTAATVTLGEGFVAGEDMLLYTPIHGIAGSFDSGTGVLRLSGTASSAEYQAALRAVEYRNIGGARPSTALRTVTFALGTALAHEKTGHFHEFISFPGTWAQARDNAATRTHFGRQGYLATLTSAVEDDFVRKKLPHDGWMGAQASPETGLPRSWSWVTGPEGGTDFCLNDAAGSCNEVNSRYQNWAAGEPGSSSSQGCGQLSTPAGGKWTERACAGPLLSGYFVEYGGMPGDAAWQVTDSRLLQVRAKTEVTVTASSTSVAVGQGVTLTANLLPASATGMVQFLLDGAALGASVAISGGEASLGADALALGTYSVSVTYGGDNESQPAAGSLATPLSIVPMANGQGPCTQANASTHCSSGSCSASGRCVPQGPDTCYLDSDCGANRYCDRNIDSCVDKGAPGALLPNDALHDGICSLSLVQKACATPACNAVTNTCADINGAACTSVNQCVTNVCGDNGKCGLGNGESGCDAGNAASLCQSKGCTAQGVCVPPEGCFVDADCLEGQFCNRAQFACQARLPVGSAIPNDGLHQGVCVETGKVTCTTRACNPVTNTCADANGAPCSSAMECVTNVCGTGGICGEEAPEESAPTPVPPKPQGGCSSTEANQNVWLGALLLWAIRRRAKQA